VEFLGCYAAPVIGRLRAVEFDLGALLTKSFSHVFAGFLLHRVAQQQDGRPFRVSRNSLLVISTGYMAWKARAY
jgi:hypothetical protein